MLDWLTDPPQDFRQQCKQLEPGDTAGDILRKLANHRLDSSKLEILAKALRRLNDGQSDVKGLTPFRLGIIGHGTTDLLVPPIIASGLRYGLDIDVVCGPYGQVLQTALDPHSEIYCDQLDAVLLAVNYAGYSISAKPGESHDAQVASIVDDLIASRDAIRQNGQSAVIFQTIPPPAEMFLGNLDRFMDGGPKKIIADVNHAIAKFVYDNPGDYLLDVEGLASSVGLNAWHDPSHWHMAKLPFSTHFTPAYADLVARKIGAIRGKSRKCLVLDLDNTLWGGVIGDDGLEGIELGQGSALGEAFLEIQRTALSLRERGIVLAVCSKNDHDVALKPFQEHPDMLIKESHIAVFQANWMDKASNLEAIAETLNIGIDSLVFLDDNPTERDQVRQELPSVAVPELPKDPSFYPRTLLAAGYFEATSFSEEDKARAEQYGANASRAKLMSGARDLNSFLASLDMTAVAGPVTALTRPRVTQLINKSNQFNLTTRRYTEQEVEAMESADDVRMLQFRLLDRFGDNGMICVIICHTNGSTWNIDTWLMSCRVLGRKMEQLTLNALIQAATNAGAEQLVGQYIPSGRNKMVEDHYKKLGFRLLQTESDGSAQWSLNLKEHAEQEAVPITLEWA